MFVKKTWPKRILAVACRFFCCAAAVVVATEQVSYIGFTSDVHGETGHLSNWLGKS